MRLSKRWIQLSSSIVLCMLLIFCGCSKDEECENCNDDTADYFPLVVGNEWTFQVYYTDSMGTDTTSETQTIDHISTSSHDSLEWYVMIIPTSDTTQDSAYYRKDNSFVYSWYFSDEMAGLYEPFKVAPTNPEVGYTWTDNKDIIGDTLYVSGEIEAKETITVPAGTFECYRSLLTISGTILFVEIDVKLISWFADDVGPVRLMDISDTDTTDRQLESYSLE